MNEKRCDECKNRRGGQCTVPMWCNGRKVTLGSVPENGTCELWEQKDDEK